MINIVSIIDLLGKVTHLGSKSLDNMNLQLPLPVIPGALYSFSPESYVPKGAGGQDVQGDTMSAAEQQKTDSKSICL